MNSDVKLSHVFFSELKQYNGSNFKTLRTASLTGVVTSDTFKAFSSVITRYFIFASKHPEISPAELRVLYFQLKIDMIGRYFASYPASNISDLVAFQRELLCYLEEVSDDDKEPIAV